MDKRGIIKLDSSLEFRRNIAVSLTKPNKDDRYKIDDKTEKVIIDQKEHLLLPLNVNNKGNRRLCIFCSKFNKKN